MSVCVCAVLVHLMAADFRHWNPSTGGSQINDTAGFRIYFRFIKVSGSDSAIALRCTAHGLAIFQCGAFFRLLFLGFFFWLTAGVLLSVRRLFYLSRQNFFVFHFSLVFGFGGLSQCTPNKSNSRFFLSVSRGWRFRSHICICGNVNI